MSTDLGTIPVWVLVVLAVLAVVQLTLDVVALVDLYRRPVAQVVFANKWIWLAIVLLVNTVGAIIYLAVGRKPAPPPEDTGPRPPPTRRPDDIADALYGSPDDPGRR